MERAANKKIITFVARMTGARLPLVDVRVAYPFWRKRADLPGQPG